jgi:hypothetical protein
VTERRSLFDAVKKYFGDSPWVATQFTGQPVLRFTHEGANGRWTCIAHAREAEERFTFYSIGLATSPEELRGPLAEFITRANFGLIIGNFEMDLDDGEVRFKTSIDVEGDRLRSVYIDSLVRINIQMMDKYLPGLRGVVEARMSPYEAIVMVEGPPSTRAIRE